jgi:hypothetical protein
MYGLKNTVHQQGMNADEWTLDETTRQQDA